MRIKYFLLAILGLIILSEASADNKKYSWKRILPEITYDIAINQKNPNTIYAGGQGRIVYVSYDAGKTWYNLEFGTIGREIMNNILTNRADSNLILAGGMLIQNLARSTDAGKTWNYVEPEGENVLLNGKAMSEDPNDPNKYVFANFNNGIIYESNDMGASWDSISKVFKPTQKVREDGTVYDTLIEQRPTCFFIRTDSNNIFLAGNQGGAVMLSQDKGKNWLFTDMLQNGTPAIDPYDTEVTMFYFNDKRPKEGYVVITYVGYQNTPNGGVWKTTDGGYNWDVLAFQDTSFWAVACKTLADGETEIFVGGYVEDAGKEADSIAVPGRKVVRGSFDSGKTWWIYDLDIDWVDPSPVLYGLDSYDSLTIAAGTRSKLFISKNDQLNPFNSGSINNEYDNINAAVFLSKETDVERVAVVGNKGLIYNKLKDIFYYQKKNSNTSANLKDIKRITEDKYIVSGSSGTILISEDKTETWRTIITNTAVDLNCVEPINTDKIFAVGKAGTILKSIDGGENWTSQKIGIKELKSIRFLNENLGYICGVDGLLFKTIDGGDNWVQQITGTLDTLNSIEILNIDTAVAVGLKNTILKTFDGGNTWIKSKSPISQDFYKIKKTFEDSLIIVGTSTSILVSSDYGESWRVRYSEYGPVANVWSMRYLGPKGSEKLYMATEAGLFVLDDVLGTVRELIASDPKSNLNYMMENDNLLVTYKRALPNSDLPIIMSIYDINGKLVSQKNFQINSNENIFDIYFIGGFASGSYILDVIEGNQRVSKTFVK